MLMSKLRTRRPILLKNDGWPYLATAVHAFGVRRLHCSSPLVIVFLVAGVHISGIVQMDLLTQTVMQLLYREIRQCWYLWTFRLCHCEWRIDFMTNLAGFHRRGYICVDNNPFVNHLASTQIWNVHTGSELRWELTTRCDENIVVFLFQINYSGRASPKLYLFLLIFFISWSLRLSQCWFAKLHNVNEYSRFMKTALNM